MHISQAIPRYLADSTSRTTSSLPACIERVACQLGARYNPDRIKARFNLHADEFSVKSYLGTYLPRTVFEFLTIGHDLFGQANMLKAVPTNRPLRILDLGSGIGGAWMGLASALFANGRMQPLHIDAVDGNRRALAKQAPFARAIAAEAGTPIKLVTTHCTLGADAASFAKDLVELLERLNTQYDFVLVSKHLSEFYCAVGQAATGVVYEALHLLAPALTPQGYLVVLDLSTRIDEAGEYFPNLMAREIGQYLADHPDGMRAVLPVPCAVSSAKGCAAGQGQCFTQRQMNFSHSIHRTGAVRQETTKVTYRVLTHQAHARQLTAGYSHDLAYHVNAQRDDQACHRGRVVSQVRGVTGFFLSPQKTQGLVQPRVQPFAAKRQQPVVLEIRAA